MKKNFKNIPYNNRELSWLDFNKRVLEECLRKDNSAIEKLNFISIVSSNLDEFFMVRVGAILEQINCGYKESDFSGLNPCQQMTKIIFKAHDFVDKQYKCLNQVVLPEVKKSGFVFVDTKKMSRKQLKFSQEYFDNVIFPILTPLAVDKSRPFPLLMNKSLNIVVRLLKKSDPDFKVIQVPSILPRFLFIPSKKNKSYAMLENIIIHNLYKIFDSKIIKAAFPFRITRNADFDINEEAEDLLSEVRKSIKKRRKGIPVRLEIAADTDSKTKKFLRDTIEIEKQNIYKIEGPIDLTFLSKFINLEDIKPLRTSSICVVSPPADFYNCTNIFSTIKEKDRMLHNPYESFDPVIDLVNKAAYDKNVLAIKQTLYRVSENSPIVSALIKAAESGKQVTVLVEVKARFDEENNIIWAKKLENAGCHVIYGVPGLKTHCKILLIARREKGRIRRYLHFGTGNYNETTAKHYTDIGIFTCKEDFGKDGSHLFNALTGGSKPNKYEKIIVSPIYMRKFFKKMIRKEIENKKKGLPSGIIFKINSLSDQKIIKLLYKASQMGVEIKLIIRGICCLIPQIKGISDKIKVFSIVGHLLEHSRIYKFQCAGKPRIFIGSADLMPRNLDRRIEVLIPVEDEDLKLRIIKTIEIMLKDNVNLRHQLSDTSYLRVIRKKNKVFNSQIEFSKFCKEELIKKIEENF
ncbi:MAG: polyphosphate kinase 1 [Oscillospiraceae bacterium]|jgi:polyphosphate kinase|nr:polyphosphate kinase 1 [Oscillospiraceae bacterium]